MRLYELEAGDKKGLVNSNLDLYINTIKTRCSDALTAIQNSKKFLYRGVKNTDSPQFKGKSRDNRRTLMTKDVQQEYIDSILSIHGFEALRSNSIFCSSSIGQVSLYGTIYLIFPVNGFDFTWSPNYKDLFAVDELNSSSGEEVINHIISNGNYRMNNFTAALGSGNEIMIKGEYYAFRRDIYESQFAQKLLMSLKDIN